MIYELINPSDPYTFTAPSFMIATATVCVLGSGQYGAHAIKEDGNHDETAEDVPIFLFGGSEAWFKERGIDSFSDYVDAHREEIATCLETFIIGSYSERRTMERVLEEIRDEGDRVRARERWHDERRSSMNDIGLRAARLASVLRRVSAKHVTESPTTT